MAPGYHPTTEIVYVPTVTFDPLPEHPTQADAKAAADRILTYVKEFPFASDADKAVWLAGVLTAVARPAIAGAAPGFALIGNRAGVGKGMLVHIAGIIATGRPIPSTSYPQDADEARKVKVTLALSGVQLVLLDDLDEGASYGNGPLDSVITETTMNERLLGVNKPTGEIKLRPTWWLTGNNVVPGRDAHRRWLVSNIVSDLEHPEERVVEIENLLEHIYKDRGTLLRDVLIILKAHAINGYKNNWKAKLGSFYEWDTIVRGAVWYATGQDCNQTRREAAAESPEYLRKLSLLDQLENVQTITIDGKQSYANGFTIDNLLSLASETDGIMGHNFRYTYQDLRNALMKFAKEGLPSAQSLGNIIAKLNKVLLEGKMIVKSGKDHHAIIWQVLKAQSQPTIQLE